MVKVAYLTFFASLVGHYYGDQAARVTWSGWFWKRGAASGAPGFSGAVGIGTSVGLDCDQTGRFRYSPDGPARDGRASLQPALHPREPGGVDAVLRAQLADGLG